jgi:hypothetical protein
MTPLNQRDLAIVARQRQRMAEVLNGTAPLPGTANALTRAKQAVRNARAAITRPKVAHALLSMIERSTR